MVECDFTVCIHNKQNKCTLENIKITAMTICDSCSFQRDPNNPFAISEDERVYKVRKNAIIII